MHNFEAKNKFRIYYIMYPYLSVQCDKNFVNYESNVSERQRKEEELSSKKEIEFNLGAQYLS